MARLFAMGLRVSQVAAEMGYSISRVSVHYNNPAFKELVAQYGKIADDETRDSIASYNALILSNGMKAERKIADKLDDDENDELSIRELLSIARDAADRVGLSKRSLQTNISIDFAAMLDKALDRTAKAKVIDNVMPFPTRPALAGAVEVKSLPVPVPFKRRF